MKEIDVLLKLFNPSTILYLFEKLALIEFTLLGVSFLRSLLGDLKSKRYISINEFKRDKITAIACGVFSISCITIFCLISERENFFINVFIWSAITCFLLFKNTEKICISAIIMSVIIILSDLPIIGTPFGILVLIFAIVMTVLSTVTNL